MIATVGRLAALLMLACLPVSLFFFYAVVHRPGLSIEAEGSRFVVVEIVDPAELRAGARVGDVVDATGLSVGNRERLVTAPLWKPFEIRLRRGAATRTVPLTNIVRSPVPPRAIVSAVAVQLVAAVGIILAAILLWRRPGPLAFVFAAYAVGGLYAGPTAQLFGFLPEPWYSAAIVAISVTVAALPPLALVAFALRFPHSLHSARGRLVTRVFDAILVALCVLAAIRTFQVPTLYDLNDPLLDTAPSILATLALVAIVLVRYARTNGADRRRLGWVALGSIVSGVGVNATNFQILGVVLLPPWVYTLAILIQMALPVAFAYAILKYRVIDLGFALNRTVVYAAITVTLVVAVGAVNWISGKLLSGTHLSAIVEAVATISLGAALGWMHQRIERGVDLLLFRDRYLAAKRIQGRIGALGYATTTESIDEALVDDVVHVMHLASAAVFRRRDVGTFTRSAAVGWDDSAREISIDHLLARSLRNEERSIDVRAASIVDDAFPCGVERPCIAIPIVVRHDFLGFALYGQRPEDATIEREEIALLERLCTAAAAAYDGVDAAEWRRRALALQQLQTPALPRPLAPAMLEQSS